MKELEWEKKEKDYLESKPLHLKCDCRTEGLDLQYYRYEGEDKGMYFNFWQYSINSRYNLSLWEKIRYCWKILTRSTLHGDYLIYDKIENYGKEEQQEED